MDFLTSRNPALEQDHQSWLIWWLVENHSKGWYIVDEKSIPEMKDSGFITLSKNYKTLGGTSGYGNVFSISTVAADASHRLHLGQQERTEIMERMRKGFKDETIGTEVDYQFFMDNNGWYLAEIPDKGNQVGLFYRGSNDVEHGLVVKVSGDLMPVTLTKIAIMTHNDIDTDTIRFLDDEDSWVLGSKTLEVLNWSRFPTVFLE